jgi:hypothetical protein
MRLSLALIAIILAAALGLGQVVEPIEPSVPAAPQVAPDVAPAETEVVTFALTVNGGKGGGDYPEGEKLTVQAALPPEGKVFDKLTSDVESLKLPKYQQGKFTMPGHAITLTATYKDAPPEAAGAFLEMNGMLIMEAENGTAAPGKNAAEGIEWVKVDPFEDANGAVMQALPNLDVNAGNESDGPSLNFKVYFQNPGNYYLFVRTPVLTGRDNSVNIGLDGQVLRSDFYNGTGRWSWGGRGQNNPAVIAQPGVHTVNVWMREDGVVVDRVLLITRPVPGLDGTQADSPPESTRLPETEGEEAK